MKKFNQPEILKVIDLEEEVFSYEEHLHNHFDLIYIHYGKGIHIVNDVKIPYREGDLFLLAPGDHHFFQIEERTRYTYIKFTANYFESHKHLASDDFTVVTPLSIMQMQWLKEDKLSIKEPCQTIMKNTLENILFYQQAYDIAQSPIIFYQIVSIFGIIKEALRNRNIILDKDILSNGHIGAYIHEHIYYRNDITIGAVARKFGISPNYFSTYFKKKFGMTYREYIEGYQLKLVKKRLHSKKYTLKEIADEFSFTDVSHLTKFFKKHEGITPAKYRELSNRK